MKAFAVRAMTLAVMTLMVLALCVVAFDRASTNVTAYSPITVSVEVAAAAEKSAIIPGTITIVGGPAADGSGNYSYKAEIIADNKTGSSVSPSTGTSSSGKFGLNITMPGYGPQTITLKVNVTSKNSATGDSISKIHEVEIKVVDPIILSVTVHNTGVVDAKNVTARFYADGILLNTQIFNVSAGSSKVLRQNWTWVNVANGKHVVSVVIDDPNGIVEFSDGNNVYSMTVYIGEQGNPIGGVLTVGVIIMSVLLGLTMMTKPVRKKK